MTVRPRAEPETNIRNHADADVVQERFDLHPGLQPRVTQPRLKRTMYYLFQSAPRVLARGDCDADNSQRHKGLSHSFRECLSLLSTDHFELSKNGTQHPRCQQDTATANFSDFNSALEVRAGHVTRSTVRTNPRALPPRDAPCAARPLRQESRSARSLPLQNTPSTDDPVI